MLNRQLRFRLRLLALAVFAAYHAREASSAALVLRPEQCPPSDKAYELPQYATADVVEHGGLVTNAISSNYTLVPFGSPLISIDDLFAKKKAVAFPRVCDNNGRCIDVYEINASVIITTLGFKDASGKALITEFLAYDQQVPGPTIEAEQGVQTLVRLHNFINCNTTTWKAQNTSHYGWVTAITMHHHGSESLSPFDGWARDDIPPCGWKDYVYPNNKPDQANWYHDHTLDKTSKIVGSGLFGTYYVKTCNAGVPENIKSLGDPAYLVLGESLFLDEGNGKMNPWFPGNTLLNFNGSLVFGSWGDHITVNGKPWPQVKVQRRPYHFILLNGCMQRYFMLHLEDKNGTNLSEMAGLMWVLGTEGSFRSTPVEAPAGLLITQGERYRVVIDFSRFDPGTEIYLTNRIKTDANNFTNLGDNAEFCYTHLVMKFVVGDEENATTPFNPFYSMEDPIKTFMQPQEAQEACAKAMAGNVDFRIQTKLDESFLYFLFEGMGKGQDWKVYMGDAPHLSSASRRSLRGAQGGDAGRLMQRGEARRLSGSGGSAFIPISMPTYAWSTWELYNNDTIGQITMHPMHLHMMDMYICGRTNDVTKFGIYSYELMSAKDTVRLSPGDHVYAIIRFGPHEGSYMFHCHNTAHEDEGLMGQFNSTYALNNKTTVPTHFDSWAYDRTRYKGGPWGNNVKRLSPGIWKGADPLVRQDPKNPIIGRNLYYAASMPPSHYKQDPKNPGRPQPLTTQLAHKVLERNYYQIFYPNGRKNLKKAVKNNNFAVVCQRCAGC